jgi:acyl-CoA thioesterase-1
MLLKNSSGWRLALAILCVCGWSCGSQDSSEDVTRLGDAWSKEGAEVEVLVPEIPGDAPTVMFLGDSMSAGLHLDADLAFPAVAQRLLAQRGQPFRLINAGVSGDTTSGGLSRIDWLLKQEPRVVVVELGCNDGLRGLALEDIESNLRKILERIQAADAVPLLLGMHIPTSLGPAYAGGFTDLYVQLAEELEVAFVPNFLGGVGGEPELNLPDGIHPNPGGHALLADNLAEVLEGLLEDL